MSEADRSLAEDTARLWLNTSAMTRISSEDFDRLVNRIADSLASARRPFAWVPTSERMPEPTDPEDPGRFVLVVQNDAGDPDGVFVCKAWYSPRLGHGKGGFDRRHVTHWAELPDLPHPPESESK